MVQHCKNLTKLVNVYRIITLVSMILKVYSDND